MQSWFVPGTDLTWWLEMIDLHLHKLTFTQLTIWKTIHIVVNGILTDYLSQWGNDVYVVVVSFSKLSSILSNLRGHRMLRRRKRATSCYLSVLPRIEACVRAFSNNDNRTVQKPGRKGNICAVLEFLEYDMILYLVNLQPFQQLDNMFSSTKPSDF